MAFLNKVGNLAKSATDKAGEMVEVTKLNTKINESKGKITTSKTQIGEYYWKKYESGEGLDDEVMEICASIKAENDTIDQLNNEIQRIKGSTGGAGQASGSGTFCTSCGAAVPSGKNFCAGCGAKVG